MTQQANWPVPPPGANDSTVAANSASGTIFPSTSRGTGTYDSPEIDNPAAKGVRLFINTTAVGAAGTLTVAIQTKDQISGSWVQIEGVITPSITTNKLSLLDIYPGLAESAGAEVSAHLGTPWRVEAVVGGNAVTFSVSAVYLA